MYILHDETVSDRKGSLKNRAPLFFMVMVRQVLMMGRIVSRKKKEKQKEKNRETQLFMMRQEG